MNEQKDVEAVVREIRLYSTRISQMNRESTSHNAGHRSGVTVAHFSSGAEHDTEHG